MKNVFKFFAVLIISSVMFSSLAMAQDKPVGSKPAKPCCAKEKAAKCSEAKKECSEAEKTGSKVSSEKCETLKKECATEKKEIKTVNKETKPEKK
jgi:hypothetical protein